MTTYRQHEHAFAMEADDKLVVVDREGAKMLTLNAMGGVLWLAAAEPVSVDDLVSMLADRWPETAPEQLRADTERFVAEAVEAGILVVVP